jgi:hypothetical protein
MEVRHKPMRLGVYVVRRDNAGYSSSRILIDAAVAAMTSPTQPLAA